MDADEPGSHRLRAIAEPDRAGTVTHARLERVQRTAGQLPTADGLVFDPARLNALRQLALVGSPVEAPFERLTELAAEMLDVPIALVSLVDDEHQFFKCSIGLPEPWASMRSTPLSHSFCQHVVELGDPLIVEDAREDPVLRENLAIKDLNAIAYAGIPLVSSDGYLLGTFCAIDKRPRRWTDREVELLTVLAEATMTAIEVRYEREVTNREKAHLELVLDALPASVWTLDDQLRFTSVRGSAIGTLGMTEDQIVGSTLSALFGSDDGGDDAEASHRRALLGERVSYESQLLGATFDVHVGPLRRGDEIGVIGLAVDITERKEMERNLMTAQKMEVIGQLAAGIAHDFNNILTVVLNYATLVLEEPELPDLVRNDLVELRDAGERAASLSRRLLLVGRGDAEDRRLLELNALLRGIESLLRGGLPDSIDLRWDLADEELYVEADPKQLEQVVTNLVLNARDAMPDGGRIGITTRRQDGSLVLEISDTGVGMPPEVLRRAREALFTTKAPELGTGLGLFMVATAVERMGGDLSIWSSEGIGTKVTAVVPAAAEPAVEEATRPPGAPVRDPARAERADERAVRVLVVEDDPALRAVVARMLSKSGHETTIASGPAEALTFFETGGAFDVVLTDIDMPDLSGVELAKRIRHMDPATRIILMTGYGAAAADRAAEIDAALLEKPFSPAMLEEKVREVTTKT